MSVCGGPVVAATSSFEVLQERHVDVEMSGGECGGQMEGVLFSATW